MKRMKLATMTMAAILAALGSTSAIAAPATNTPTGDQHTTIGIMQTGSQQNISFEVPLYITMAAQSNSGTMTMPTEGYDIINTTTSADGKTAYKIGVTNMKIKALGDWSIVADGTTIPTTDKTKMTMKIGSCAMPAVDKTHPVATVSLSGDFVLNGKPKPIDPNATLSGKTDGLKLEGTIANTDRTDAKATAQFNITYTVAALDSTGQALGAPYVGDDKNAAGFQ